MELLGNLGERRREIGALLELEISAAGFVRDLSKSAIGPRAYHSAVRPHVMALEPDRVNHHFLGARAIDHGAQPGFARRVVAIGEHQNHAPSFEAFQLVQAHPNRVPQPRAIAVVQILGRADELVTVVREPGAHLNLVVERADLCLVVGQ